MIAVLPWDYPTGSGAWRRACSPCAWLSAGALVGAVAWGGIDALSPLLALIALPLLWGATNRRWDAGLLVLGYFAAGARGLPQGAVVFFGEQAPAWFGWGLWLSASMLLAVPFVLTWSSKPVRRGTGFVLATVLIGLPPLAIVGWLNPVSIAGVFFPGMGWVGLLLTLVFLFALVVQSKGALVAMTALSVLANAWSAMPDVQKQVPDDWMGFDTHFAQLSSGGADQAAQHLATMKRITWLKQAIAAMPPDSTLVLPETVIGRLDGVVENLLAESEQHLRAKRSRALVGAEIPDPESSRYYNGVIVLGAQPGDSRQAVQGIPVPVSMWKPWADDGAIGDIAARGNTIEVGQRRIGVAVCYEQLLSYSMLRLMLDRPHVVAAVSNVWWARATNIPLIQKQSAAAFARLFDVPLVMARNW